LGGRISYTFLTENPSHDRNEALFTTQGEIMAEEAKNPPKGDQEGQEPTGNEAPAESSKKAGWAKRFLNPKWLGAVVVVLLFLQGGGFLVYRLSTHAGGSSDLAEVDLGNYQFIANELERGRIVGAEFSLHIALLPQVAEEARLRLEQRKFRVQQGVEQLLRQAHGGDFDDPTLGELKRQLQEQINETLGMRAISDVIVTDLQLDRVQSDPKPTTAKTELAPWMEKPSG